LDEKRQPCLLKGGGGELKGSWYEKHRYCRRASPSWRRKGGRDGVFVKEKGWTPPGWKKRKGGFPAEGSVTEKKLGGGSGSLRKAGAGKVLLSKERGETRKAKSKDGGRREASPLEEKKRL